MTIFEFEGRVPSIAPDAYVDEDAKVLGDVKIGRQCFIGAGARIRGDYGTIVIGEKTSIQENCVLHARVDERCTVGSHVQIGHGALLHNCTVKDYAVVGVGAVVSDYATVGVWAILGEGAVVPSNQLIPDGKVAVGVPAKIIRDVSDSDMKLWTKYKEVYADLAVRYPKGLKRIK